MERRAISIALVLSALATLGTASPPAARGAEPTATAAAPVVTRVLPGVRPDSAALLTAGGEGGPLRSALLLLPGRGASGPRLFLYAEVDGESLLRDLPEGAAGLELSTYVLDPSGGVVAHASEGLPLPTAEARDELARGGLRYATAFDLAPGDYTVRFLARLRPGGAFGVREAQVRLTPVVYADAVHPVALWADPHGSWIEARSPALAADEPPRLPGALWPSALPLAPAGAGARLLLAMPEGVRPPSTLRARLVAVTGGDERTAELSVGAAVGRLGSGLEALETALDLAGVPLGIYEIRLAARAGLEGRGGTRLVVVPGDPSGAPPPSWVGAFRKGPAAGGGRGGEPALAPERAADRADAVVALRRELIAALAPLTREGDLESAAQAMLDVEIRALDEAPRRALDRLGDAHTQLRVTLTSRDPETLLPLALVFTTLAEKAALARRPALSSQAQETAARLAETYARRGAPDEAPRLAARMLMGLAGRFWDLGSSRRAQKLLAIADPLDPADGTAGRLVALVHERNDERAQAVDVLQSFLERHPGDREARLRLALSELELVQPRGERRLRELAEEPVIDWVGNVTNQELIRLELAGGRYDEATRRARESLQSYPADPALRLQLSWALQQSGKPAEALSALDAGLRETNAAPARRRYSAWPSEVLRAALREAVEAAQLRLPALRAALPSPTEAPTTTDAARGGS